LFSEEQSIKKNQVRFMKNKNIYKKIIISILTITIIVGNIFLYTTKTSAAFNAHINYQGKLTNSSNVAVADGLYDVEFKLYTQPTGGVAIWTETNSGANKVQVTNGLFSVMMGSTTPFTGVDFNQTLYLGVKIEADSEMTPRKVIGAVPAAFVADTLDGISSNQFLRSDIQNSTSTVSTFLNILQSGAGKIAEFFGPGSNSALSILSGGNVGIGTTSPIAKLSLQGTGTGTGVLFRTAGSTNSPGLIVTDNGWIINRREAAPAALIQSDTLLDAQYADDGSKPTWRLSYSGTPVIDIGMGASWQGLISNPYSGGSTGGLQFRTGGAGTAYTRMTITKTGDIGIGTSSPIAKLSVTGSGYFGGNLTATGTLSVTSTTTTGGLSVGTLSGLLWGTNGAVSAVSTSSLGLAGTLIGTTGQIPYFNGTNSVVGTSSIFLAANGNVGIGSTSPSVKLSVSGSGYFGGNLVATGEARIGGKLYLNNLPFDASVANSIFIGDSAGALATNAFHSNFFGSGAGYEATLAFNSNFFGQSAGIMATNAQLSNFIGYGSGIFATWANTSNFIGSSAGANAEYASQSNFIGDSAGMSATNANSSSFIGVNAGNLAANANNSIFIGNNAGYSDSVNNSGNVEDDSILIGNYTSTGGYSNSIAIGNGAMNSATQQLNVGNVLFATGMYNSNTPSASPIVGGRIGIGTSSPIAKLSVVGDGYFGGNLTATGTLSVTSTTTTGGLSVGTLSGLLWGTNGAVSAVSTSSLGLAGTLIGTTGQIPYFNGTNSVVGTSSIFLAANGNVGIGTTTPISKLTVDGNTEITGNITLPNSTSTITLGNFSNISVLFDMALGMNVDTGLISGLDFKNSNSSGQVRLLARNNQNDYLVMNTFGSGNTASFFGRQGQNISSIFSQATSDTDKALAIGTINAGDLILGTANTERMVIKSTGNVGIGTTNPGAKLDVTAAGAKIISRDTTEALSGTFAERLSVFGRSTGPDDESNEFGGKISFRTLWTSTENENAYIAGFNDYGWKAGLAFGVKTAGNGTSPRTVMTIRETGNVEIGETSVNSAPASRLVVKGSGTGSGTSGLNVTSSSGTSNLFVRDDGYVGIGTTLPGAKIHIATTSATAQKMLILDTNSASDGTGSIIHFVSSTDENAGSQIAGIRTGAGGQSAITISTFTTGPGITEKMRIDEIGNVGIGSTTPSSRLTVSGDAWFGGNVVATGTLAVTGTTTTSGLSVGTLSGLLWGTNGAVSAISTSSLGLAGTLIGTTGQIPYFNGTNSVVGTSSIFLAASGNVGIGTTSPNKLLHLAGSNSNTSLRLDYSGAATGRVYDINPYIKDVNNAGFEIYDVTGSASRLTISSTGNVGIGTTSPSQKLEVSGGNIQIDNNRGYYGRLTTGVAVNLMRYDGSNNALLGANSEIRLAGSVFLQPPTGGNITITGGATDGPTAVGTIINTLNTLSSSTAKLVSFRNTSTEQAFIGYNGSAYFAGNVGIGSSTPVGNLVVKDPSTIAKLILQSGDISVTAGDTLSQLDFYNADSSTDMTGETASIRNIAETDFTSFANSGLGFFTSYNVRPAVLTEKMRITSNGNVGIGTTTPATLLHVLGGGIAGPATSGTTQSSGQLRLQGGSGNNVVLDMGSYSTTGMWLQATHKGDLSLEYPLLLNPNGGNVGIGTTSPGAKLEVWGGVRISGESVPSRGHLSLTRNSFNYIQAGGDNGADGALAFITAGRSASLANIAMYLKPDNSAIFNGNVGIGTTTPNYKLSIEGSNLVTSYFDTTGGTGAQLIRMNDNDLQFSFDAGNNGDVNTNLMTLTSTGNVGIGTTTPNAKLAVYTDVASTDPTLVVQNASAAGGAYIVMQNGDSGLASSDGLFFGYSPADSAVFWNRENTALRFGTNDIERARIDNNGNVGIGTTTPIAKLSVTGSGYFGGNLTATGTLSVTSTTTTGGLSVGNLSGLLWGTNGAVSAVSTSSLGLAGTLIGTTGQIPYFNGTNSVVGTSSVFLAANGNVGIGTTSPTEKLTIAKSLGSGYTSMLSFNELSNNGNNSMGIDFRFAGAGGYSAWGSTGRLEVARQTTSSNFDMLFHTSNTGVLTEKMRILANGNIGIGTSSPSAVLHVVGTIGTAPANNTTQTVRLESSATAGVGVGPSLMFRGKTGNATSEYAFGAIQGAKESAAASNYNGYLAFFNQLGGGAALTENMRLTSAGNLGISSSTPSSRLTVSGNAWFGGNVVATGTLAVTGNTTLSNASTTNLSVSGQTTLASSLSGLLWGTNGAVSAVATSSLGLLGTGLASSTYVPYTGATTAVNLGSQTFTTTGNTSLANASTTNLSVSSNAYFNGGIWNSAGYVGIGISDPGMYLEVLDTINIRGAGPSLKVNGNNVFSSNVNTINFGALGDWTNVTLGNSQGVMVTNDPSVITTVGDFSGDGNLTKLVIDDSNSISYFPNGNVGIGTTTPESLLTVSGTSSMRSIIPEGPYTSNISDHSLGSSNARWSDVWAQYLNLGTSTWSLTASANNLDKFSIFDGPSGTGNERLTILNNGNMGIGISNPNALLHTNGTSIFEGTANFRGAVAIDTDPDNNASGFEYGNGYDPLVTNYDNERFRVNSFFESPNMSAGVAINYLLRTEEFDNASWVKTNIGTVTANLITAANGTVTAENIPAGSNGTANIAQTVTNAVTGFWTAGVWARAQSGTTTIGLRIDSSAETGTEKTITLDTKWRYFAVKQNLTSVHTNKTFRIISGTNAISLWGARMNPGETSNSYFARTSSALTTATPGVFFNNQTVYATTFSGSLSGAASSASYSNYGVYVGGTLSNASDKTNQWEYIGATTLTYNSTYRYGHSWNYQIDMKETAEDNSVRPQNDLEDYTLTLRGNLATVADATAFDSAVPEMSIDFSGNTNLTANDIAAVVYSKGTASKIIRYYVKLKKPNSHYLVNVQNRYGYAYSSAKVKSVSYTTFAVAVDSAVVASLPTPAQGSVVYGTVRYGITDFWRANGSDIFSTSTANVGLGTTTPFAKLTVAGNGYFTGDITGANLTATGTLSVTGQTTLGSASTTNLSVSSNAFLSGGVWNSSGDVGIGTTSPSGKLHISGTHGDSIFGATGNILTFTRDGANFINTSGSSATLNLQTMGANRITIENDGDTFFNSNQLALIAVTGKVGIGTTTPSSKLTVAGDGYFTGNITGVNITSTGNLAVLGNSYFGTALGNYIEISGSDTNPSISVFGSSDDADLALNPKGNGQVLIGGGGHAYSTEYSGKGSIIFNNGETDTPNLKFAYANNENFAIDVNDSYLRLIHNSDEPSGVAFASWSTDYDFVNTGKGTFGTEAVISGYSDSYFNGGNLGVGNNSPTALLHISGSMRNDTFGAGNLESDADGNITVSSDERLKNIQGNFNRGLSDLLTINPIMYKWKDTTGYDTRNTYAGFSAQNVQLSIPEAVGIDSRGMLTLSDRPILATLVNAMKELNNSVNNTASSTLSLLTCTDTKCLIPKVNELSVQYTDLADIVKENSLAIEAQQVQFDELKDEIVFLKERPMISTSTLATSTASILEQSTTFITKIADAVRVAIASSENWVISKLSATYVYSKRIEAETVAISQGLEMKDQITGLIYCVVIKNGDWERRQGTCEEVSQSSTTPAVAPAIINTYIPSVHDASSISTTVIDNTGTTTTPIDTITSTSTVSTTTPTITTPVTSTSTEAVIVPPVVEEPTTPVVGGSTPDPVVVPPTIPDPVITPPAVDPVVPPPSDPVATTP
jgi:hypothetical protein